MREQLQSSKELDVKLLWFVFAYRQRYGYSPSMSEMQAHLEYPSICPLQHRLARLIREGRLSQQPRTPRSIVLPAIETEGGKIPVLCLDPELCQIPIAGEVD